MTIQLKDILLWGAIVLILASQYFFKPDDGTVIYVVNTEAIIEDKHNALLREGRDRIEANLIMVDYIDELKAVISGISTSERQVILEGTLLAGERANDLTAKVKREADKKFVVRTALR